MAVYKRPGVYVEETLTPTAPIVGGSESAAIAVFVGASDKGPVTPTLVSSWSQYCTLYGGWNSRNSNTNDLPLAVYMYFANGGAAAYVYRIVDSTVLSNDGINNGKSVKTFNDADDTASLVVEAINPGTWGNDIYVYISDAVDVNRDELNTDYVYDMAVYYGGTTAAYAVERYSNLSSDASSERFVESVVNSLSAYVQVSASSAVFPAGTGATPVALVSGTDGDPVDDAMIADNLSALDVIRNAIVLNACGVTDSTQVDKVITYAEGRQDVFVIIDPSSPDLGVSGQLDLAALYTPTSLAAVYYPHLVISDPTVSLRSATRKVSPSGAVMGVYAGTDVSRGVFKAPAGLSARLANVVSVATLSNTDLDNLNSAIAPVNAIKYVPGSGIVVMGARTLKSGYADRYIPTRRTLIYLRKELTSLTEFAIFEPNDARLWRKLDDAVNKFLTSFWQVGGLRGESPEDAFFVKCDEENNTLASVNAGEVNIEVGVALTRPAEFVIIKIGQFDGGATVTVV